MGNSLLSKLTFGLKRLQESNPTAQSASTTDMLSNKWPKRLDMYRALFAADAANPGSVGAMFAVVDKLNQRNANMQDAEEKLAAETMKQRKQNNNNIPTTFLDEANQYLTGVKIKSAVATTDTTDKTGKKGGGLGDDDVEQFVGVKNITMNDRFIFVAVTYVVRLVCLFLIDWSISTNMVDTFKHAFLYYTGLYCLLIIFLTFVVSNNEIGVQMLMYYMNTDANGYARIMIHLFIIFLLLPILYIIQDPSTKNAANTTDYEYQQSISQSMSTFTMITWMLTSAIALRF